MANVLFTTFYKFLVFFIFQENFSNLVAIDSFYIFFFLQVVDISNLIATDCSYLLQIAGIFMRISPIRMQQIVLT